MKLVRVFLTSAYHGAVKQMSRADVIVREATQFSCVLLLLSNRGTAVAQWLRRCATNRKVAGSIPDGVNGNFSLT